ncbi:MAG: LCP family protein [Candidatus Doudnabacteria bacterium]|nr:LCP family protein [Candidatus Doudnabacteria bacterium]
MAKRFAKDTSLRRKKDSRFTYLWQTSKVASVLNRLRRRAVRPASLASAMPSTKRTITLPSLPFRIHIPKLKRSFFIKVFLAVAVVAIVAGVIHLSSLKLTPSVFAEQGVEPLPITGDTINILFVVYDKVNDYEFCDFVAVVSLNKKSTQRTISIINVDKEFAVFTYLNRAVKLRSMLATTKADDEPGLPYISSGVQAMLGIRLDRYVFVSKSNLIQMAEIVGVEYLVPEEVADQDVGFFAKGQKLQGQDLIEYLAIDQAGADVQSERFKKFLESAVPGTLGFNGYLRVISQLEKFMGSVETDISVREAWELALNLYSRFDYQYIYIGAQEGTVVTSKQGGYLVSDSLLIDQKLEPLLAREPILREQARIEVFNATGRPGLATATKRLITNQGGKVIRAGNAPEAYERTTLYVEDPERYSANISLINELLRGDLLIVEETYPYNHTGDLVLVLGGE